jgi:hypothetical protein
MAGEAGAQAALERLEKAFQRIEAASAKLRQRGGDPTVAAKHRRLQDEVQTAIAGLDRLLAAAETR